MPISFGSEIRPCSWVIACRGTNLERYEKATATNVETWRRGIARQVLEPPFVNSGIVALHGEIMAAALLRSMVQDALRDPQDSSCEQTIIASAVKLGGEVIPGENEPGGVR